MSKDVVYPLGPNVTEEFKYSLRSLRNLPDLGRVFVMSATPLPDWVQNINLIETPDFPKWESMHHKFIQMCGEKGLSKQVYLFEDDFYILRKLKSLPNYSYGTVRDSIKRRGFLANDNWKKSMLHTLNVLTKAGVEEPIHYDTHIPIIIDRAKAPLSLDEGKPIRWHTAYGNMVRGKRVDMLFEPKVTTNEGLVTLLRLDSPFLSSEEDSFASARVWEALDMIFPEKSKYER